MRLREIDLPPILFQRPHGDYHFGLFLQNLHQEENLGSYLPLLGRDFKVVNSFGLASILDPFTGGHESALAATRPEQRFFKPISSYRNRVKKPIKGRPVKFHGFHFETSLLFKLHSVFDLSHGSFEVEGMIFKVFVKMPSQVLEVCKPLTSIVSAVVL
ncbi:LOW QUALITY PROTEIN: hypothetical protein PanWU01x14_059770 [Parasponia andersonii]|uniref:Uncharacterized protein n=1 Tax=Parasponia andersonii TaxID=3476 RepID=A0A2P5DIM7_PARAD|nr:LOW QUALITY PROTEIN: hypothetical protein PanWU01x14_059770 [Parasponia andersonii]